STDIKEAPGKGRALAEGRTGHDRVERACSRRCLARNGAPIETIGFVRLNDNVTSPGRLMRLPQVGAPSGRQPADPALDEHMGWKRLRLPERLFRHHAVTLHHIARND